MEKLFSVTTKISPIDGIKKYIVYILGIKLSFKQKWNIPQEDKALFDTVYQYSEQGAPCSVMEHRKNVADLYKNLDETAKMHLDKLFYRINKIVKLVFEGKHVDNSLIYDKDELDELEKVQMYFSDIKEENGYWQLKNYKLPERLFTPPVFYSKHGMHTLKTLDKLGDKVILDVGCCIGDSILVFRDFTKNKIIAFEPVSSVWEKAMKTVELNNIKDVKIEKFALGDREEETKINITPDKSDWGTMLVRDTGDCETIKSRKLDDYVRENNLKVGLIKVDIEGFEPKFLEGAIETIKEQKPILLLSIYHNYHDFYKIKPWLENLNLGYKFDFFKGMDGKAVCETLLIAEVY